MMTSKDRLLRSIRHEEVDRVPISPRYFDFLIGKKGCCCVHHCIWMADQYEHDLMPVYKPLQSNYFLHHTGKYNDLPDVQVDMEIENAGDTITVKRTFKTPAGNLTDRRTATRPGSPVLFDHITEPLIKNRSDAEKVRFLLAAPDEAYIGEIPLLQQAVGDRGILLVRATQGVDQFVMDALGVENAMLMYHDDRMLLQQLLDLFQQYHRAVLRRVLEQGAQIIFEPWYNCSMSVGWSPRQFEELFLPFIRDNFDLIHSYGAYVDYYDDGKMDATLEFLADVGADIVETLGPPPLGDVDLTAAKKRIGERVCLKGHIDQVNLICRGTVDQIRSAVRTAIDTAAPGGGFILGTADSIRPESPEENIRAYFEAAHEFGTR